MLPLLTADSAFALGTGFYAFVHDADNRGGKC